VFETGGDYIFASRWEGGGKGGAMNLKVGVNALEAVVVLGCLIRGGKFVSVGRQISFLWGASCRPYGAPLPPEAPNSIHQPQNK